MLGGDEELTAVESEIAKALVPRDLEHEGVTKHHGSIPVGTKINGVLLRSEVVRADLRSDRMRQALSTIAVALTLVTAGCGHDVEPSGRVVIFDYPDVLLVPAVGGRADRLRACAARARSLLAALARSGERAP
jgi:hypothetical protein